jgi:hypothetical protein
MLSPTALFTVSKLAQGLFKHHIGKNPQVKAAVGKMQHGMQLQGQLPQMTQRGLGGPAMAAVAGRMAGVNPGAAMAMGRLSGMY